MLQRFFVKRFISVLLRPQNMFSVTAGDFSLGVRFLCCAISRSFSSSLWEIIPPIGLLTECWRVCVFFVSASHIVLVTAKATLILYVCMSLALVILANLFSYCSYGIGEKIWGGILVLLAMVVVVITRSRSQGGINGPGEGL
jgi:hypothetical protein